MGVHYLFIIINHITKADGNSGVKLLNAELDGLHADFKKNLHAL